MTPASETILNPFIGSECGKRGKVVVRNSAAFTPLKVLIIIPKQRPFVSDWPILVQQQQDASDAEDIRALRASLKNPEDDIDYETVRRKFDL